MQLPAWVKTLCSGQHGMYLLLAYVPLIWYEICHNVNVKLFPPLVF